MPKFDQKAKLREVAEKIQRQKEEDAKKDQEFFEKITSGPLWTFYKVMMIFCLVLLVLTTIDTYVDGPTRKVGSEYKFERSLYATNFQSIWVDGDLYTVHFDYLVGFDENTFKVTDSFIFRDPKKLSFIQVVDNFDGTYDKVPRTAIKRISIYDNFPYLQIVLILPLVIFLFRQPKPWFNFIRFIPLLLIYPGSILLTLYLLF